MSQVEQKRACNKLKHDIEPYRNVIILLDSILTWQKKFYPAIITVAVSALYLLLWLLNLSTVTMLALFGFFCVIFDLIYPSVSRILFSSDNWSGDHEVQFDHICEQIFAIKITILNWYEYIFNTKERKSTMFVVVMSAALLLLAWIGSVINNLLLMYFITLGLTLFPGIKQANKTFNFDISSKMEKLLSTSIKKTE